MQLPKCVYPRCLTAAEYITQTCSWEGSLLYCVCELHASCVPLEILYVSLALLFHTIADMCYTSPGVCEYRSVSTVLQWSVSHGDFITWPPNDTHSVHPADNAVAIPRDHIKQRFTQGPVVSCGHTNPHSVICCVKIFRVLYTREGRKWRTQIWSCSTPDKKMEKYECSL